MIISSAPSPGSGPARTAVALFPLWQNTRFRGIGKASIRLHRAHSLRMRGKPLLGGHPFRLQPMRGNGGERQITVNQTRPQRPQTMPERAPRRVRRGNCGGGNNGNIRRSAPSNPRLPLGTSSHVHPMYTRIGRLWRGLASWHCRG